MTVIQPCMWFMEEPNQFSMGPWAKHHRAYLTCSVMEKPHTGYYDCHGMLLSLSSYSPKALLDQRHLWRKQILLSCIPPGNCVFFARKSLTGGWEIIFDQPNFQEGYKIEVFIFATGGSTCHILALWRKGIGCVESPIAVSNILIDMTLIDDISSMRFFREEIDGRMSGKCNRTDTKEKIISKNYRVGGHTHMTSAKFWDFSTPSTTS